MTATSKVEEARFSESVTAVSEVTCERWLWAIDQMAPSSLALETRRPVEIWFCAVSSAELVEFRVSSAIEAPTLVLILFSDMPRVLQNAGSGASAATSAAVHRPHAWQGPDQIWSPR